MQKITFKNSEGTKLVGALHVPDEKTDAAVIVAHGFTSNKDRGRFKKLAKALTKSGIAAFRFDFGGSGESEDREIIVKKQVDDLTSAVELLKDKEYKHIGVLGESLGGMVALKAYSKDIGAMVLWAPVTQDKDKEAALDKEQKEELQEKGYYTRPKEGRVFKMPQEYLDERKNFDYKSVLGSVEIPVMVVHGTADEAVPIQDSEEAITLLPEGSRLEKIENWEHGDHKMEEDMDIIIPKTVKWFKNHLL